MCKTKKVLQTFGLVLMILLASMGIGMTGVFLPTNRERYMDVEIKIEQVDKKKDEQMTENEDDKTS